MSGSAKIPVNFRDFLRNNDNKRDLFSFLSNNVVAESLPEGKSLLVTNDASVPSQNEITVNE